MTRDLPSLSEAKTRARELRVRLGEDGRVVSHGEALELVARQHGFRDWNGLSAALAARPPARWMPGARVSGRYLAQPFTATVLSCSEARKGWHRLSLQLDRPVDVVASEGFSNLRSRVQGVVGPRGTSQEKTSDGRPHLELEM